MSQDAGSGSKVADVFAMALVGVSPQIDGELAFQTGDLIEVTEIIDDDWMYGRCRGKEGLVSAVCVELLNDGDPSGDDQLNVSSDPQMQPPRPSSKTASDQQLSGYKEFSKETTSGGSYTSQNTRSHVEEITPYGRIVYSFTAELPTEMSVTEGEIVTLIRHVDSDWTEGEVDGRRGLFPTSFVDIIVDCPHQDSQGSNISTSAPQVTANTVEVVQMSSAEVESSGQAVTGEVATETMSSELSLAAADSSVVEEFHEIGLVTFTFVAEVSGDVSVKEGDTVEVTRKVDENWLEVKTEDGVLGLVPLNHVQIIGPWPKSNSNSRSGSLSEADSEPPSSSGQLSSAINAMTNLSSVNLDSIRDNSNCDTTQPSGFTSNDACLPKSSHSGLLRNNQSPSSAPNLDVRRQSCPPNNKPALLPKPSLRPKPTNLSSKSVSSSQRFSLPNINARSSESSGLKSFDILDSLIEVELKKERAKTRSSSNNSNSDNKVSSMPSEVTMSGDSARQTSVSTRDTSEDLQSNHQNQNMTISPVTLTTPVDTQSNNQSHNTIINTFDPLSTLKDCFDSSVTKSKRPGEASKAPKPERPVSRPPLRQSHSVTTEGQLKPTGPPTDRQRPSSFKEKRSKSTPQRANSIHETSHKDSAFVNSAFQMDEVAEGNLLNLEAAGSDETLTPPRRPPPTRPPSRPAPARPSTSVHGISGALFDEIGKLLSSSIL